MGWGGGVSGGGRGGVKGWAEGLSGAWGVIDPALSLSLTSSWCRNNLSPGTPSHWQKVRVASSWLSVGRMGRTPPSGGWFPLLLGLLPPLSSRQISGGVLIVA